MTVFNGNFSGMITPSVIDSEYVECNFSQPAPIDVAGSKKGARIFPGDDTPRTFTRCNLVNAEPPPGSTINECNTTIMEIGLVDSVEDIIVDGVVVGTVTHHKNVVHGRILSDGSYDYLPTPREEIVD